MTMSRFLPVSRIQYFLVIAFYWLVACCALNVAHAAINVSGNVTANTTWTVANQPYTVTGDIIVDSGATLTIEAGVTVYMNAATSLIVRNGALNARGTPANRITFTSSKDVTNPPSAPAAGDWGSIRFEDATLDASTAMANVDVRFGSGIVIQAASPALDNLNISQQNGPAIAIDLASSPQGKGLTAAGNKLNGILVPAGDITGSVIWGLVGIPYILEQGIVSVGRAPISLTPTSTIVVPGVTVQYTVQLGTAAPAGGLALDVVSSVPSVATVPATVTVAAGATSAQFVLNAVAVGFSTVTVSKLGLGDTTAAVRVDTLPTITLSPSAVTLGLNKTRTIVVALSQAAPSGGLVLGLASSSAAVATAPATLAIAAGASSGSFDVATVGAGNATITASTLGYANGVTAINVRPVAISLPTSTVVAPGATVSVPITLTEPAPTGGLTVSLTPVNTGVATVAPTVAVAAGASAANVNVTGVAVGTTTINATAPGYEPGTGGVVVDSIAIDFQPTGNQTIVQGLTTSLSVRISKPAPTGGVAIALAVADTTKATVSPASVTIAAGQTASLVPVVLTGVAPGTTSLTATSSGLASKTINLTVTSPPVLTFYSSSSVSQNRVGKGLRTGNGYYGVQRTVNGSAFNGADAVTVTLTSSDPGKLTVPTTVTIPANQSIGYFQIAGVDLTTAAVQIDATATGYTAPTTKLAMQVVTPEIVFVSLDTSRTTSSARDDFYMRWNVTGAWDSSSQTSASDITIGLAITNDSPAGIVGSIFDAATAGSSVTSRVIAAGRNTSQQAPGGFNYVGIPTQSGSYTITASVAGIGSWTSAVQNVTSAQLRIYSAVASIRVGNGLRTASNSYYVERIVNGTAFSGPEAVTVTLSCTSTAVCSTPASVTIPANQSIAYITIDGTGLGSTTVVASATGYLSSAGYNVDVVRPDLQLLNVQTSIRVGAISNFYVRFRTPGAGDDGAQTPIAPRTISLTSATPGVATTSVSVVIPAGVNTSPTSGALAAVLTGVAAGTTTVTASATDANTVTSSTITVAP
jgi:trimeric autotransporter adhesin